MTSSAPRSIPPTSLETSALRDALERHRTSLVARLEGGEDGVALGRANARFLNACFQLLFADALRQAGLPNGVALAAVGSFGRGAVALHSDADVVLIVDTQIVGAKEAGAFVEALLYPLWDAGLAVGHQVLSAGEVVPLAEKYLETATALLDLRHLAGDEELLRTLVANANEGLFGDEHLGAFIDRLEAETTARRDRFGGSVYLLEPDVKSGAGGLRDLDGIRWAARARYRVGEESSGAARPSRGPWRGLVQVGVMVAREANEIAECEEFLWRVRNRLHLRAGRKADRLGFEDQEALAVSMGYGDDRALAAERLMQAFYLCARTVTRARASLFERLRPQRRRGKPTPAVDLGGGVHLFDGQVALAGVAELQTEPVIALRAFSACVRQRVPLLPFARDAITSAAEDPGWCERLRATPEAALLFVELVCTVPEVRAPRGSIVGDLHDAGLLLAMVPEFRPVTGRVHHDVYHVYTVDVHSVSAVDRLRQLARGELAHEYPLASRLAAEIARPRPLFLATLLHDVGKGYPDASGSRKNHSRAGAELCDRILPRLGVSGEDVDEARALVRDHLLMYHVATHRDLDDIATIEEFCQNLRGREGLRNLYLLTMADVTTTSPTAMTSWKARMLEELYFASESYLMGKKTREDAERIARVVEAVRATWKGPTGPLEALLASLPERYLLANRPESIAAHALAVAARGSRPVLVVPVPSRHPEAAELCIVAEDRPGLLESIAAALTANRLEVLSAEVYSHPVGAEREALDLFWVRDRDGGTEGVDDALPRLARDLEDVCSGRMSASELLRIRTGSLSPWRDRPSPDVPTEVLFDNRASPRHTIVEVYAKDRRGLLHRLARTLYELRLSITLSKINTEGARVADVFYVSELDGSKVAPGARHQQIHDALLRAVDE
ncbi:MAG TPA: [protein-PII] uridylyltransferase [Polyangiaceae bacterium]|nr:[protein-PII] uridylyltransferase [Polyangiaceae bacterium]